MRNMIDHVHGEYDIQWCLSSWFGVQSTHPILADPRKLLYMNSSSSILEQEMLMDQNLLHHIVWRWSLFTNQNCCDFFKKKHGFWHITSQGSQGSHSVGRISMSAVGHWAYAHVLLKISPTLVRLRCTDQKGRRPAAAFGGQQNPVENYNNLHE